MVKLGHRLLLVDSHCHLDFPDLIDETEAILARAKAAGVNRMVTICTRLRNEPKVRALAETLFNDNPTKSDHTGVPTAVFSQPQVGTVGLTEKQARALHPPPFCPTLTPDPTRALRCRTIRTKFCVKLWLLAKLCTRPYCPIHTRHYFNS